MTTPVASVEQHLGDLLAVAQTEPPAEFVAAMLACARIGASHLAGASFLRYSSGSTGKPKGIEVTEGNELGEFPTLADPLVVRPIRQQLTGRR